MNGPGVRPNKLWHWGVVIFLVATLLTEPAATMALTWQLFKGAGAIGGELLTGEPSPDVLGLDPETPDDATGSDESSTGNQDDVVPGEIEDSLADPTTGGDRVVTFDATSIRGVLDRGADGVVRLRARVEDIQHHVQSNDGLVVRIGGQR